MCGFEQVNDCLFSFFLDGIMSLLLNYAREEGGKCPHFDPNDINM